MPKNRRLHHADEFTDIMYFRNKVSGNFLQIHAKPNNLGFSRLGLIVAKKIARHAVVRNRVKRILREAFRMSQLDQETKTMDWVIRLKRPVNKTNTAYLTDEAKTLMLKLQQCHD